MAKIISFEGGIGAGKSTLVNFFAAELGLEKILEDSYENPFVDDFYAGANVKLETELVFLLQHYSLLKNARAKDGSILADFSIEKDLVFARMNLTTKQYYVFKQVYDYVVENVGLSDLVIFLDPPFEISSQNIANRGRPNEVNINLLYFKNYADHIKSYFVHESKTKVLMMDNSDLELDSRNEKVREITDAINVMM